MPSDFQDTIYRVVGEVSGLRIVVSLYGRAEDAPRTDEARRQFCSYVADLITVNPQIKDVVIWNDPNDQAFWAPQYNADGSSAAPADYEALLATCWDAAHAVNPNVNIVSTLVSRASAIPGGFTVGYHPPATWVSKLAAAYKASGRTNPIFDTFGYIPKALGSAERPWAEHPNSPAYGIGDYDALVAAIDSGFQGTSQPLPGQERHDDLVPRAGLPDGARFGAFRPSTPVARTTRRPSRRSRRTRPRIPEPETGSTSRCSSRMRSRSRTASHSSAPTSTSTWSTRRTSPAGSPASTGPTARRSPPTRRCARRPAR